jgi:phage I-like protein
MDLFAIADAPTVLDDSRRKRIPVARIDRFKDKRYGAFSITAEDAASWKRNLAEHFNGEALIDFDHSPEKGKGTRAAGWIRDLVVDGEHVLADVEFTPAGADAIRNGEFRYISPTFVGSWKDEHGVDRGKTLLGAGLTNRPFLRKRMPAISLSEDFASVTAEPEGSDSRGRMSLSAIATKLGLADDADEALILDALDGRPDVSGKVILDATEHADLLARASKGDVAETSRFDAAYTKALSEGRVAPASKAGFEKLAETDLDLAVKTLDELPQIVKTAPAGEPAPASKTDAGDRDDIDRRAKALSAEKGISYVDAVYMLAEEDDS